MRDVLFASIARTRAFFRGLLAENVPLAAGRRTGRPSSRCNELLSPVDAETAAMRLRLQAPPTPWRRG